MNQADFSRTEHVPDTPIDYTVEITGTRDEGAEVVVSLVNQSTEPVLLDRVWVEYRIDGVDAGRHEVYFHDRPRHQPLKLEQFAVQSGHFHIADLSDHQELHTRILVDVIHHNAHQTTKLSHRLSTERIVRKRT